MKILLNILLLNIVCLSSLYASDLEQLLGVWGTEQQCARELLVPGGTKKAAPFEIQPDWLGNGDVWCRINWTAVKATENGVDAMAHGLCGEDNVRDYQIRVILSGEELQITWNFFHSNGPLFRCEIQ